MNIMNTENIKTIDTRFSPGPNWMEVTIKLHNRSFTARGGLGWGVENSVNY